VAQHASRLTSRCSWPAVSAAGLALFLCSGYTSHHPLA
jgi:hypothetical protein